MPTKKSPRPQTLDHLKKQKSRITRTVWLPTDEEVAATWAKMKSDLQDMKSQLAVRPGHTALEGRIATLEAEMDAYRPTLEANSIKFKFQALGRKKYKKLLDAYPPTEAEYAEVEEARKEAIAKGEDPGDLTVPAWSPNHFPPALVAHSLVEPEATVEELIAWFGGKPPLSEGEEPPTESDEDDDGGEDAFSDAELLTLFGVAIEVNGSTNILMNLGKG